MQTCEKTPALIELLRQNPVFENVEIHALQWLVDRAEFHSCEEGDYLFKPDDTIEFMDILMKGRYEIQMPQNGEFRKLGIYETGTITGVLPFSRMVSAKAYGLALERVELLSLHKKYFTEMVQVSYTLTQNLVGVMSDRVREFTSIHFQNEKLMALGKLSAGLAHELNNPASSIVRNAETLYEHMHLTPDRFKNVMLLNVTPQEVDVVNELLFQKMKAPLQNRSILEKEDAKDELLDWLEDRAIENSEVLADTFVEYDFEIADLEVVQNAVGDKNPGAVLHWVENNLTLERLIGEIREASDRIGTLIGAVKSYTHMDQGSDFSPVDVQSGLTSTLVMLKHKIKAKNVEVVTSFGENLPKVMANPGEINQVWTNLIDNALDAMDKGGTLQLQTNCSKNSVYVKIIDDGPGITDEVIDKIFDPFFTTKSIGEGTGMGLEVVQRIVNKHKGTISVDSHPGATTFLVCLPVK